MTRVNRERKLLAIAAEHLAGVGDAALGEWREVGDIAVHLRRRLTAVEIAQSSIGDVCDVRGTDEFARRIHAMRPFLPPPLRKMPMQEYP